MAPEGRRRAQPGRSTRERGSHPASLYTAGSDRTLRLQLHQGPTLALMLATFVCRAAARWRPWLARVGREVRSRERFNANSPRRVGPERAGELGFGAEVEVTEARSAPFERLLQRGAGPSRNGSRHRPDDLVEASKGDAKKNPTSQSEGEALRSDGSQARPAIQDGLGAQASILS
jgi:hypothetical protein